MKVAVLSFAHERAATYARLLHEAADVDLAVADPGHEGRGSAVAAELGATYFGGWEEVFAWGPDAVVVTAEATGQRPLVERAALAGAHVLCERPFADDEADAEAMVDACERAGVRLRLASPVAYGPAFAAVRAELAKEDVMGGLTTVYGALNPPLPRSPERGVLDACAPYLLDLVDAVLGGQPAQEVYAQANSVLGGDPDVASAALLTVRYADSTVLSLDCSWGVADRGPGVEGPVVTFVGERASVEFSAAPRLIGGFDSAGAGERWVTRGDDPYAVMLAAFLAGVRGGADTGPDGAAGLRALRIVRAARESVRTGQPVEPATAPAVPAASG
ncbi:Gfo/Idh/MocA family oxidoreductase [Streptomyces sp. NPDC001941]|uniref:Gfo/Idh/MocA family protein n=1 Tax=Streptomyces sp. NPDC001941 TaxID=3154659 RepID=UPI00332EA667